MAYNWILYFSRKSTLNMEVLTIKQNYNLKINLIDYDRIDEEKTYHLLPNYIKMIPSLLIFSTKENKLIAFYQGKDVKLFLLKIVSGKSNESNVEKKRVKKINKKKTKEEIEKMIGDLVPDSKGNIKNKRILNTVNNMIAKPKKIKQLNKYDKKEFGCLLSQNNPLTKKTHNTTNNNNTNLFSDIKQKFTFVNKQKIKKRR